MRIYASVCDMQTLKTCLMGSLLVLGAMRVHALSQDGHATTAAIAYGELRARDPAIIARIVELMAQHPDRGTYRAVLSGATGETRERRLFMEMARWADDIRLGPFDHPTWHSGMTPYVDPAHPPSHTPAARVAESAFEAYALNVSMARDGHATAAERAVALCWVFHLIGDIHQPLHAIQLFSSDYPNGDGGGDLEFVRDPQSQQSLSLHWYWDTAANRTSLEPAPFAEALRRKYPRDKLPELAGQFATAADFSRWAAESYALGRSLAYRADLSVSKAEAQAPLIAAKYLNDSVIAAEQRLALAGYRLADVLVDILRE